MSRLNSISITKKLIVSSIIASVLPVLLITIVLTSSLYAVSLDKIINMSQDSLNQLSLNLNMMLTSQKGSVDTLSGYTPLQAYMKTSYESGYKSLTDYTERVYAVIQQQLSASTNPRIRIYSDNETTGFAAETNNRLADLQQTDWYSKTSSQTSSCSWAKTQTFIKGTNQNALCCYQSLRDAADLSKIKMVIAIFISEQSLYTLISQESNKVIFISNEKGEILTSTQRDLLNITMDELSDQIGVQILEAEERTVVEYLDEPYLLLRSTFNNDQLNIHHWVLTYMVSKQSIYNEIYQAILYSTLLCAGCLLLSLFVIILISKGITGRLKILVGKINSVAKGNFQTKIKIDGSDEIGQINENFDRMVNQIGELINGINQANQKIIEHEHTEHEIALRQQEAENIALQGQINPHFLFNTLENIRMNLILRQDNDTAGIMRIFSEIIREYINTSRKFAVIDDELKFIDKFIMIQKYRFGGKLTFKLMVEPNVRQHLILRLIIQPLIENAIYHGIELKKGDGEIILDIHQENDLICISVKDDGVGMSEQDLTALREHIYQNPEYLQSRSRMGLQNVHCRIKLIYGQEYGLLIDSQKDIGTLVSMKIPCNIH